MIADKASASTKPEQAASKWIDWPTIVLVILTFVLGVAIAISVGEIGPLVILAVPLVFIFVAALGQPELGLAAFIAITFAQVSNIGIKYYGFPSLAQPLAGLLMLLIGYVSPVPPRISTITLRSSSGSRVRIPEPT